MKRVGTSLLLLVLVGAGCGKRPGTGSGTGSATATGTATALATATPDLPGEMTEEERRSVRPTTTLPPGDFDSRTPPAGMAAATATPVLRRGSDVPVDTVLWTRDTPLAAQDYEIVPKEGVLRKVAPPATDADQTRYFPYALDYWGIVGSGDLGFALDPHLGREVRIEGHFRKVYDDGKWTYEVEPKRIVLLPAK